VRRGGEQRAAGVRLSRVARKESDRGPGGQGSRKLDRYRSHGTRGCGGHKSVGRSGVGAGAADAHPSTRPHARKLDAAEAGTTPRRVQVGEERVERPIATDHRVGQGGLLAAPPDRFRSGPRRGRVGRPARSPRRSLRGDGAPGLAQHPRRRASKPWADRSRLTAGVLGRRLRVRDTQRVLPANS